MPDLLSNKPRMTVGFIDAPTQDDLQIEQPANALASLTMTRPGTGFSAQEKADCNGWPSNALKFEADRCIAAIS
jgi:hypothetical protein